VVEIAAALFRAALPDDGVAYSQVNGRDHSLLETGKVDNGWPAAFVRFHQLSTGYLGQEEG
jgi:hypothetical protein